MTRIENGKTLGQRHSSLHAIATVLKPRGTTIAGVATIPYVKLAHLGSGISNIFKTLTVKGIEQRPISSRDPGSLWRHAIDVRSNVRQEQIEGGQAGGLPDEISLEPT